MPQSRTRYQRAAMRSRYRKPKRKRGGSFGWNVAIAAVVIGGIVAVFLVRGSSDSAGSGPPRAPDQAANVAGDHWHTAFQVNICGEWLTAQPQFEKPADNPGQQVNVGIHTHGDDLIHTHPFANDEAGDNATLGRYLTYAQSSVSSSSIKLWDQWVPGVDKSNGDKCPGSDKPGKLYWKVDAYENDGTFSWGASNPADAATSYRIVTIMLATDY